MIDKAKIEEWKVLAEEAHADRPAPWIVREDYADEWDAFDASGSRVVWSARVQLEFSAAALDAIPALLAERKELIALLHQVEWADNSGDEYRPECPACGGAKPDTEGPWNGSELHEGHRPDCRLAAFLG